MKKSRFTEEQMCHETRNHGEYEGELDIDEHILEDLIVACRAIAAGVKKLVR